MQAFRAPLTLLFFQAGWLFIVFVGFALMFWGFESIPVDEAIRYSGSSLLTLGFAAPPHIAPIFVVYAEAVIGLTLLALLISYLPTIYAAFQKREFMVSKLAVRAGSPGSPWQALAIANRTASIEVMDEATWTEWENWFIEIAESHTSLVILNFYRSPDPNNHWVAAARTVLDLAALRISAVDIPTGVAPHLTLRSGTITLRTLANYWRFPYNPDPRPSDPISITRAQFDAALEYLETSGVPIKADRDEAWVAFTGWRVNYDSIIAAAAAALNAPPDPWDGILVAMATNIADR